MNANAPPRGGTRRRLWRGNPACGQVWRQSESRTQFAYLHIILALAETSEGQKGRREPKAATGCPWILLVSVPKGNCSACLIYGCESATKLKLRNSETEAEARTETVISCDAWPKPQLSPPSSLAYPFHSRKLGTRDSSLVTHQP